MSFNSKDPSKPADPTPRRFPLPTNLSTEVRSPGLASRLSSYIRSSSSSSSSAAERTLRRISQWQGGLELSSSERSHPVVQPRYQGLGLLPRVRLNRVPLPTLTPGDGRRPRQGPSVCTVKVAPVKAFSPFQAVRKGLRGEDLLGSENVANQSSSSGMLPSSDSRRLIAVLQEMSARKRDRSHLQEHHEEEEEEEEDGGSKRARRDSSSSMGSSLSMEMPPLFSNGVVGQTTSQLVSRETDLSLNSLLSRSQAIFNASHPTFSISSNMVMGGPGSSGFAGMRKSKLTCSNEITSSLSSSINMKRARESDSEDESDDEEVTFKAPLAKQQRNILSLRGARPSLTAASALPSRDATLDVSSRAGQTKKNSTSLILPKIKDIAKSSVSKKSSPGLADSTEHEKPRITCVEDFELERRRGAKRAIELLSSFEDELLEADEPEEPVNPAGSKPISDASSTSVLETSGLDVTVISTAPVLDSPEEAAAKEVRETASVVSSTENQEPKDDSKKLAVSFGFQTPEKTISAIEKETDSGASTTVPSVAAGVDNATSPTVETASTISTSPTPTTTTTTAISAVTAQPTLPTFSFGTVCTPVTSTTTQASIAAFSFPLTTGVLPATVPTSASTLKSPLAAATPASSAIAFPSLSTPSTFTFGAAAIATTDNATKLTSATPVTSPPSFGSSQAPAPFSFGSTATTASTFSFGTSVSSVAGTTSTAGTTTSAASSLPSLFQMPNSSSTISSFGSSKEQSPQLAGFSFKPAPPAASTPSSFSFGSTQVSGGFGAAAASSKTSLAPETSIFSSSVAATTDLKKPDGVGAIFSFGGGLGSQGSAVSSKPFQFTPAAGANTTTVSSSGFSFGNAGSTSGSAAAAAKPMFSFGSGASNNSAFSMDKDQQKPALPFQFDATGANKALDPKPAASMFSFGSSSSSNFKMPAATTTAPDTSGRAGFAFGPTATASSNPFQFGMTAPSTAVPAQQGGGQQGSFSFNAKPPSFFAPPQPTMSSAAPQQQKQESSTGGIFSFGGASQASKQQQQPAAPSTFSFGASPMSSQAPASSSSGLFAFGAPAPQSSAFGSDAASAATGGSFAGFGATVASPPSAASSNAASGMFQFGSSSSASMAQPGSLLEKGSNAFTFGSIGAGSSSVKPSQSTMSFGSSMPPANIFGSPPPSFGGQAAFAGMPAAAAAPPPSYGAMGLTAAPPAFGTMTPTAQSAQQSMFSIGAGNSAGNPPKGRQIARARRTKR